MLSKLIFNAHYQGAASILLGADGCQIPPRVPLLHDLASRIRGLLAAGDLDEALDQLLTLSLNGPRDLAGEAILLAGRRAHDRREERKGVVTREQAKVDRALIADAARNLLDELERKLSPADALVRALVAPAEAFAGTEAVRIEKILGVNNLKQVAWLEQGLRSSRAVCRVLTPDGLGTGFLVGPRTLMTNNHVIPSAAVAGKTKAEFNYQFSLGEACPPANSIRYDLDPATLFRTDSTLDYTLVAVRPAADSSAPAVDSWGRLRLNPNSDPVTGDHVVIVQHPNGGPKVIVLTANAVLQLKPPHLHYSTDTMPGSSGAPVFNDLWEVIGIHHAAGPAVKVPGGGVHYSNEGVLMSAVRPSLAADWPN